MSDPRWMAFNVSGGGRRRGSMNGDSFGKVFAGVVTVGLVFGLAFGLGQCAPGPEKAVETLRVQGFTDVKVTDTDRMFVGWSGCSDKDGVAHHATATNPRGERVTLTVCCGLWFKGCTVRVP